MSQASAIVNAIPGNARVRVRTPGKYIVLWLFAPVFLVAIGAGLWLNVKSRETQIAALEFRTNASGDEGAYFTLPEFLVDLSPDRNGRTAYLKMQAAVALNGADAETVASVIETKQPLVVERLTFFLRELRPEDFAGSESMARVKREMARRVNLVIAPEVARDVVIEDLVIQ